MSTQKAHALGRFCVGSIAVLYEVPVNVSLKRKISILNTDDVPEMQPCVETWTFYLSL